MTRVVVKALTETGKLALRVHREGEEDFRRKAKKVPKFMRPKALKEFLKTESSFTESEHVITGFEGETEEQRTAFYNQVKQAFFDNGATLDDFEVKFFDE